MLYTQPQQGPAKIDWNNPITKGMSFSSNQCNPYDLVSGFSPTDGGSGCTKAIGKVGVGTVVASGTSSLVFGAQEINNITGTITCLAFGEFTNMNADRTAVAKCAAGGSTNTPFDFGTASGARPRLARSNSGYKVWAGVATVATGRPQVVVVTQGSDISVAPKFYVDGVFDTGTPTSLYSGTGTGAPTSNTVPVRTQNRGDFTTPFNGTLYLVVVWNRILSKEEIASISANPWQIFIDEDDEDEHIQLFVNVATGLVSADGSSIGSTTLSAVSQAICGAYGTSSGIAAMAGTANTLFQVSGASLGVSSANSTAVAITQSSGASNGSVGVSGSTVTISTSAGSSSGTGVVGGSSITIFQGTGNSTGASTVSANTYTISTSSGSSSSTTIAAGSGVSIWQVSGSSLGISSVLGNGQDGQVISGIAAATGVSTSTANVLGQSNTIAQVVAAATSFGSATATGALIFVSNGAVLGVSTTLGTSNTVKESAGQSSGSSSAQSVVVVVMQAIGFSVSAAAVNAASSAIKSVIGNSTGVCSVSGVTQGGIHYTAFGDKFNITIMFAPYVIDINSTPYTITRK